VSATPAAAALAQPDVALRDGEASLLYGRTKVGETPPEALGTSGGHIYEYQRRVCTSMFISRVFRLLYTAVENEVVVVFFVCSTWDSVRFYFLLIDAVFRRASSPVRESQRLCFCVRSHSA
ncbi:hypothetical protein TcCL_ESM07288, partial [Trypanosoma cruzi]